MAVHRRFPSNLMELERCCKEEWAKLPKDSLFLFLVKISTTYCAQDGRLFLLRRLRSFGVQGPLLRTFYDSVVASAIFYGIVCWASSIIDRDRRRIDRLVRRASSVLGCPLDSVEVVGNGRMMAKLSSLLNNTSHPLQDTLTALGSSFGERLLHPRCVKERSKLMYDVQGPSSLQSSWAKAASDGRKAVGNEC
ncbi:hypothetical protein L3Q82_007782 [Scortum barcoo]|uniref:Uncharacterized protein n=1 Tax=Scortum barcoo TaxID=214431 RepID=A0ACB8WNJ5_9TELE|nr:hypothetical protein L3Q82_007782 [Scortum barcoo]